MKSTIDFVFYFTLLINVLFSQSAFSQPNEYHPIPLSNATWRTDRFDILCYSNIYSLCSSFSFYPDGDTTINSVHYTKFYLNDTSYEFASADIHLYYGALRQDTNFKKVYFFAFNQLNESVLYNFNLDVGDTSQEGITQSAVVESIDSVLIGMEYHRRFNFFNSYPYSIYLIEGVGTNGGLFSGVYDGYGFEKKDILKCFKKNGTTVFQDSTYEFIPCDLYTGNLPFDELSPLPSDEDNFRLVPNPAKDWLNIIYKTKEDCLLTLYDINGKQVASVSLFHYFKNRLLNVSELTPGVYLATVSCKGEKVWSEKVVVQR